MNWVRSFSGVSVALAALLKKTQTTKSNCSGSAVVSSFLAILAVTLGNGIADAQAKKTSFSSARNWNLKAENLKATGRNPLYYPLQPGFKFIMEKPESEDGYYRKEVIVTEQTEPFDLPGIGKFECRVVQEEEFLDGNYVEQSLKWYCIDTVTKSVYSCGEISWEIDDEGDKVFEGTWRAGVPDGNGLAEPGLLMPGKFLLGARYESGAFGGSENIETGLTIITPAGKFENCVRVREYSITDPDEINDTIWAPGVGLVSGTSDGKLVASDALPNTDTSNFGKHHREKKQKPRPVAKVSEKRAEEIALKEVPGDVTSIEIEKKRGRTVYAVEILAEEDGAETDVFVDIQTGEVVGTDK